MAKDYFSTKKIDNWRQQYFFFTYQYYFDFVSLKIQFGLAVKFGKNCQTSKLFRQMLLSFIQKIISKSLKQILPIQLCWGVKNHIGYILSVHNWQKNISSIVCTYYCVSTNVHLQTNMIYNNTMKQDMLL